MNKARSLLFVVLGIAFWFNAAMIIRFFGTTVFSAGNPKLIPFFILAIPLTLLSIYTTKLISNLRLNELLKPVVIMTFTATFLDAIALVWFRQLYSQSFDVALHGAAWILWGVGLGLAVSFFLDNRANRERLVN